MNETKREERYEPAIGLEKVVSVKFYSISQMQVNRDVDNFMLIITRDFHNCWFCRVVKFIKKKFRWRTIQFRLLLSLKISLTKKKAIIEFHNLQGDWQSVDFFLIMLIFLVQKMSEKNEIRRFFLFFFSFIPMNNKLRMTGGP